MVKNNHLTLYFLFLFFFCLSSNKIHASLQAYVNNSILNAGDSILLTITYTGQEQIQAPDFSPLEKAFHYSLTSTKIRSQTINNQYSIQQTWELKLQTKSMSSQVTIPAIEAEQYKSSPIQLSFRELSEKEKKEQAKYAFIKASINKEKSWVQAEVIYTQNMYFDPKHIDINENIPNFPQIEGALVHKLGEPTLRNASHEGKHYQVLQQKLAIFPQKSGPLTIPANNIRIQTRRKASRFQLFSKNKSKTIRIKTEPISINILGKPAHYPKDKPWLPAKNINIPDYKIDKTINMGDILEFSIIITADGSLASLLPTPELDPIPLAKLYTTPQGLTESLKKRGIIATRVTNFTFIPTQAGSYRIPEYKLTWWNTNTQQVEETVLHSQYIKVAGDTPNTSNFKPNSNKSPSLEQEKQAPQNQPSPPTNGTGKTTKSDPILSGWTTIIITILTEISLLLLIYVKITNEINKRQHTHKSITKDSKLQQETNQTTNYIEKRLLTAIKNKNEQETYQALQSYLAATSEDTRQKLKENKTYQKTIKHLQRKLYNPKQVKGDRSWDSNAFYSIIHEHILTIQEKKDRQKKATNVLPPLYPKRK